MENIESFTSTSSLLSILGPIAQQVVALKECSGTVCNAQIVGSLLSKCNALESSCGYLFDCLHNQSKLLKDETFHQAIAQNKNSLECTLTNVKDFTRELHREGGIAVRDNNEVWCDLIDSIEKFLEYLTKVLLAWDHSCLRRIENFLDIFKVKISKLSSVRSFERLHSSVEEVVCVVKDIFSLLESRYNSISKNEQKEMLSLLVFQLHKVLLLLIPSVVSCIRYPLNATLKSNKEMILEYIRQMLKEIKICSHLGKESYNIPEGAVYINAADSFFELYLMLKESPNPDRPKLFIQKVVTPLEVILQHCIGLAQACPIDHSEIMMSAQNTLKYFKDLSNLEKGFPVDLFEFNLKSEWIHESVIDLEKKVNFALVRLIVMTFAEYYDIFKTLFEKLDQRQSDSLKGNLTFNEESFDVFISDLDTHADRIFQITGFAIASTEDIEKVRNLNGLLMIFEWLESCLVNAFHNAYNVPSRYSRIHAFILTKFWVRLLVDLKTALDSLVEPDVFLIVIKDCVNKACTNLMHLENNEESEEFYHQVNLVISWTHHLLCIQDSTNFLDIRMDNNLKLAYKHLTRCLKSNKSTNRRSLIKRVKVILTMLKNIHSTLPEQDSFCLQTENTIRLRSFRNNKTTQGVPSNTLSESKKILITSRLSDIPVDLDSFSSQNDRLVHDSPCTPNQGCPKHSVDHLKTPSSAEISIDITKYLNTLSLNNFKASMRGGSKRNFSLRVREIPINLEEVLTKTRDSSTAEGEDCHCVATSDRKPLQTTPECLVSKPLDTSVFGLSPQNLAENTNSDLLGIFDNLNSLTLTPLLSSVSENDPLETFMKESLLDSIQKALEMPLTKSDEEAEDKENVLDSPHDISSIKCQSLPSIHKNILNDNLPKNVKSNVKSHHSCSVLTNMNASSPQISTPQRLEDISFVRKRLENLK